MREKCKSSSGATIILALLFFLMCALAGSVILAAGTAASGRVAGLKQAEQAYYNVTSAAKTIQSQIDGQVYAAYMSKSEGNTKVVPEIAPEVLAQPDSKLQSFLETAMQKILNENINQNINQSTAASYTVNWELNVESTPDVKKFATLSASAVMNSDYGIVVTIKQQEDKEHKVPAYSCTLTIPAAVDKNLEEIEVTEEDGSITTKYLTHLTWTNSTIQKGEVKVP
ncbi:MAG: hypothetical protein PHG16_00035 [Lachnospiraceae bacterium]|nr:hypothetical protein [Lachnospiraceae bacterium]